MRPSVRSIALLLLIAVATAVSQAFGRFTYGLLLTDIRDELQITNTLAGTIGSANLAAYLTGSLAVIFLVAHTGLVNLARGGLALVTAGLVVLAWSPGPTAFAAGMVLTGFAAAGVWVSAPALAAALLGPERRGLAIGVAVGGVGLGMVASSALAASLSWRGVYWATVGAAALATLVACRWLDAPPDPPTAGVGAPGFDAIRHVPAWRSLLVTYGAFSTGMSLVMTFMVALLEDDAGYAPATAAIAFSALGAGSVLGAPIIGWLVDHVGRRFSLLAALATTAIATLVIQTGHEPGAIFAAFVFGISFTGVPVAVTVVVSDHTRGAAFGAAYGVTTIVFGFGLTLGPQIGGLVADWTGSFRPAFIAAVGCALVGVVLSWGPRRDPVASPAE